VVVVLMPLRLLVESELIGGAYRAGNRRA